MAASFSYLSFPPVLFWLITIHSVFLGILFGATVSASTVHALFRAFASLFVLFIAPGHYVSLVVMSYSVTMPLYDSA